jgi:hypothetical protein
VLGVDTSSGRSDSVGVVKPGGRGRVTIVSTTVAWVATGLDCVAVAVAVDLG